MTVTFAPVPTAESSLLEPSFVDAIAIIDKADLHKLAEQLAAKLKIQYATAKRELQFKSKK